MGKQRIIPATDLAGTLGGVLGEVEHDRLFVLTDEHTATLCLPLLAEVVGDAHRIVIPAGDDNKHIDSLCHVWSELSFNHLIYSYLSSHCSFEFIAHSYNEQIIITISID